MAYFCPPGHPNGSIILDILTICPILFSDQKRSFFQKNSDFCEFGEPQKLVKCCCKRAKIPHIYQPKGIICMLWPIFSQSNSFFHQTLDVLPKIDFSKKIAIFVKKRAFLSKIMHFDQKRRFFPKNHGFCQFGVAPKMSQTCV